MLQNRERHFANVFDFRRDLAVEQRERLRPEDKILRSARTGAPFHKIAGDLRRLRVAAGPRGGGEAHGVVDDVIAHRRREHELLRGEDLRRARRPATSCSATRRVVRRTISTSSSCAG